MNDAPRPHGFVKRPEPRSLGSATRGQQMIEGVLPLTGGVVEGDPFRGAGAEDVDAAELHGFGWLDDLAAVGSARARDLAQSRVLGWIAAHRRVPEISHDVVWRADVTGRRVLRWLFHAGQIMPGLDRDGAQPLFDSLHAQLGYLERADIPAGLPRIEALGGRAIAAMRLKGAEDRVAPALDALAADMEPSIRKGVLRSRCPEALLSCLSLLGWVKATAAETGHALPQPVTETIEDIAPILRALRHADGGMPRYHGGGRGPSGRLDHSLRAASRGGEIAPGHPMGFARLARSRATVVLDAAAPPAGPAAAQAHASTLGL